MVNSNNFLAAVLCLEMGCNQSVSQSTMLPKFNAIVTIVYEDKGSEGAANGNFLTTASQMRPNLLPYISKLRRFSEKSLKIDIIYSQIYAT